MAEPRSVAAFASAGVIATALGVYFGNSAIAEIDPVYFSSPGESRFYADLVPQRPDWDEVQLRETQAMALDVHGLGSGCIKCPDYPVSSDPAQDAVVEAYWAAEEASPPPVLRVAAAEAAAPDPELERIQRYAAFQVSEEEAPVEVVAEGDPVLVAESVTGE